MHFLELFLLSWILCFDTLAISVCAGLQSPQANRLIRLRFMLILAACQAALPFAGWWIGSQIAPVVGVYSSWIACGLLVFLGIKSMAESGSSPTGSITQSPLFQIIPAFLAGIATSIDALAVGVSLALVSRSLHTLITAFALFFITTATVSGIGIYIGSSVGKHAGRRLSVLAGIVLIIIGIKIGITAG